MMLEIGMYGPNPISLGRAQIGPLGYADDLANNFAEFRAEEETREQERLSQQTFWDQGLVRADTPGAKKLVSIKDLHENAGAPVLRAYIRTENFRRELAQRTPLRVDNLKVKKDMYRDIMAEHVTALTPLHTPSHPREDVWTELARQAGEHTDWFSREAFRIAGLLVRPDKSCTVPIGLDLETAGKITEEEVQFAALDFTIVCDQCGVWRGATQRSLKAHQALQCPRGLHEEGREYEVDCIVDEAETTKGTFLRVRWKGFNEESWEPQ